MVNFFVFFCIIFVAFGAEELKLHDTWIDEFRSSSQSNAGIFGWNMQGDILGINTTNQYHAFISNNNGHLFRKFVLKGDNSEDIEGTCDISFNIVWGCQPSINDSVIFSVENDVNINTYNDVIYYSTELPYQYLDDLRIYWGNNDIKTSPQCSASNIDDIFTRGGYEISYNYSYIINGSNTGIPFSINYIASIVNDSLMTSYFGIYNVMIYCHETIPVEIKYSKTLFLKIDIFTRHLALWITSGLFVLILFCFFCITMIQQKFNISKKNIDIKADKLIKLKAKPRGAQSILYEPQSAADVFRNMKKIKAKNSPLKYAGQTNIIINVDDDDQKYDNSVNNSKKLATGKDQYKFIHDKSGTNTPEATATTANNNDIIMPIIKDDSSDSTGHIKLPTDGTTIVKDDVNDAGTIDDSNPAKIIETSI